MSLVPFWMRFMRSAMLRDPVFRAMQEPFGALSQDPFIREAEKLMDKYEERLVQGIEGAHAAHEVKADADKVEVTLDVRNFSPEQIHVKTVGDEVVVEGRREERRGEGWARCHFERRFVLGAEFPPERVECHLADGRLRLLAPRARPRPERVVPVQHHPPDADKKT